MTQLMLSFMIAALVAATWQATLQGQESAEGGEIAWTAERAKQELKVRPKDPYIQFVVSQLSPQERVENFAANGQMELRRLASRRARGVDLFSIFSGGLAIQESLQLDTLTGQANSNSEEATVKTSSLEGPSVKSHPWTELLDGRDPAVSLLASCVPADQLFVRFQSVGKLLDMRQLAEDYATYVTTQSQEQAYSLGRVEEIQRQLALEVSAELQPVYEAAVAEIAITSSDLYFAHGNDVTLLMRLNEDTVIRAQLDAMLDRAARSIASAVTGAGEYLGVPYRYVVTSDRRVCVYSAYPKPDLHVRSNSRVALERVLSVMLGRPHQSQDLVRLSDTDEFKYIRTLMPIDAQEEDGIIYLSDPFIRNVVGPTQKLTQRSRLMCNSQLQLIAYASLLYQTQFGKKASSLEQLQARGCLGTAEAPLELRCPDGGEFTLHEDGIRGVCTHHGCLHSLLPCCEIPRQKITEEEAADYQMFVQDYNRFWTTFFDPIVIRVQQSKQRTRVETIVLPLINNSVYRGLASTLGGATEDLDSLPIASSNIFSVAARLDKEQLLSQFAIPRPKKSVVESVDEPADLARKQLERAVQNLQMLALAMHNFESANRHFPPKPLDRSSSKASGLSWRVDVLPYLENGVQLYNQFHHDEPWDSAHNRKLISQMPEQFFGTNAELNKEGKTQFLRPFHAKAAHYSKTRGTKFGEITDGTSNTIMAVVADEERAVIWTKPDDISIDMARPREGWNSGVSGTVLAAKMDGSVFELPSTATDDQVRALLTRNGGEFIEIVLPRMTANNRRPRNLLSRLEGYEELGLPEFLYDGIGNQVGIHVCDTDPLIDFNVARFLGMVGGSFDGRNPMMFSQTGMFALLAVSMNAPVYISVPLEDSEIADNFLERLDRFLVRMSREFSQSASPFFEIAQEVYTFADDGQTGNSVRAYAFRFGPLTWRFYWTRIGNGLYIASKPHLIGEVRNATKTRPSETDEVTRLSHGLIRVRPGNWKRVKSHYAVGWAESERRACSNNMGTLADVARAVYHDEHSNWSEVETRVLRTNHMQPFCPCNGKYSFDATNVEIHCSVHGSLESPKQPVGAIGSRLTELTSTLRDVFLELNFLEDGLHAIVTVERE